MEILEKYSDFADVFNKEEADRLLDHKQHDLAIKLEEEKQPFFRLIYNKSLTKLSVLHDYVNMMLAKSFIKPSKSLSKALVFFVLKKNIDLWLYVNYYSLNAITKKNKHLLPLV